MQQYTLYSAILPIQSGAVKDIDEIVLSVENAEIINGLIETHNKQFSIVKRPGLVPFVHLYRNASVDGLYWWDEKSCVIAVCDGRIFKITMSQPHLRQGEVEDITGKELLKGKRPVFATDGNILIMANGGRLVSYDNKTSTKWLEAPGCPSESTHIIYHDRYFIANEVGSGIFHYSNVNDPWHWNPIDYAEVDSEPDNLIAIHKAWRELMLFGNRSVEAWYNAGDADSPFQRLTGAYIESGVLSPYSIQLVNGAWVWLDNNRKVVVLEGRVPKSISEPYSEYIQSLSDTGDNIRSDVINIGSKTLYILDFLASNITLVYDFSTQVWYRWSYWNLDENIHERFLGNCYCYAKDWNIHLIGDRRRGSIYRFDPSLTSDVGDYINFTVRTGHINHGTLQKKRNRSLILKLKRGHKENIPQIYEDIDALSVRDIVTDGNIYKDINIDSYSAEKIPQLMIRYNDDNRGWSKERWVSLGSTGEKYFLIKLNALGSYRTRQWEFSSIDDTEFVFVGAQEEYDILNI